MRYLLATSLFVLCINSTFGQWYPQVSSTEKGLMEVFFLDKTYGWASGSQHQDSLLLKTTDGGITWENISSIPLQNLFFIDSLIGYARENMLTDLYKTYDGGYSWEMIFEGEISDFEFINVDTGFLIERFSNNLVTTYNGGNSWEILDSLSQYSCEGKAEELSFINMDIGYVSYWYIHPAGSGQWGCLLKTIDGGQSWSLPDSIVPANFSLEFYNEYRGIAGAYYINSFPTPNCYAYRKTIDGSSSWDIYYSGSPDNYKKYHSIFDLGWVIDGMNIKHTNDNGASWGLQHVANNMLRDVFFTDSLHGWAVGDNGLILHTNNGGVTVGVENNISEKNHQIKVFPNPTANYISIEILNEETVPELIFVYDMSERLVSKTYHCGQLPENKLLKLNISDLTPGVYILKMYTGERVYHDKFIKK